MHKDLQVCTHMNTHIHVHKGYTHSYISTGIDMHTHTCKYVFMYNKHMPLFLFIFFKCHMWAAVLRLAHLFIPLQLTGWLCLGQREEREGKQRERVRGEERNNRWREEWV